MNLKTRALMILAFAVLFLIPQPWVNGPLVLLSSVCLIFAACLDHSQR